MKKEWKKPQLVVVVRGSAEENMLRGCKTECAVGGPIWDYCGCHGEIACIICSFIIPS